MAAETEMRERERTERALRTLAKWGEDPGTDGGESIAFAVSRQGAPAGWQSFMVMGDCTPFTPGGALGTLHGQPAGDTGAPVGYVDDFSGSAPALDQVACTFTFDLNTGKATLAGSFPVIASPLHFYVEYLKEFDGSGGKNILFYSRSSSDDAGYILAVELVGAS